MDARQSTQGITIAEAPNFRGLQGIRHAFFGRRGGVSGGIYASLNCGPGSKDLSHAVAENRRRAEALLGVAEGRLATAYQIHSERVWRIESVGDVAHRPEADAVVTAEPGIAVGVLAADCGPVLLCDPEARVVAAAHAGWRGAKLGILGRTVAEMEALGAARARIHACLGPCIRQPSYEVGPEFRASFLADDGGHERYFEGGRGGRFQFDLAAFIGARLDALGLASRADVGIDTYPEDRLCFSYRRATHRGEPDYGRCLSAIALI